MQSGLFVNKGCLRYFHTVDGEITPRRITFYIIDFLQRETLNDEAIAWLSRTANSLPHSFARKQPRAEWDIERPMLKIFTPEKITIPAITYLVRKDNTISSKGNFYSVPFGTYRGKRSAVAVRQMVMSGDIKVTKGFQFK